MDMSRQRAAINQSALAATLVATEASRISLPKFVHNILILTGVFGTIVSLSIALLGASDMIGATANVGSLGAVIHGMSTALSTTMTAILAYLFFGYFYLRLIDVQAQIISRIEELTTTTLLPRFQLGPESAGEEFADIIRAAAALMKRLEASQHEYAEVAHDLRALIGTYQAELKHSSNRLDDIARLLRVGFRLNERNRE
jgi:signal transduction histidine kinase